MARFEWQDEYSVNDAALDEQHRQLLAVINALADEIALGERRHPDATDRLFGSLARYVVEHFAYEEQRMAAAGYPEDRLLTHRQAHDALVLQVQSLQEGVERGETRLEEVLPFLYSDWLIAHICTLDHDYVDYLKGMAPTAHDVGVA